MAKKDEKDEVERRFLLIRHTFDRSAHRGEQFDQGYFPHTMHDFLRIRIVDGKLAYMTSKQGIGVSRPEREISCALPHAQFMFEHSMYRLKKTRYRQDGWEVDFPEHCTGVVIAERESPDVINGVTFPDWIQEAVEITDTFTNLHLAMLIHDLGTVTLDDVLHYIASNSEVRQLVLTGGPCSGKSSVIRSLKEDFGVMIHCVPEIASIVIGQVEVPPFPDGLPNIDFNRTIYQIQEGFERISRMHALGQGKRLVVTDRGTLDIGAYLNGGVENVRRLMRTELSHQYRRYQRVVCMAVPPRGVYDDHMRGNAARSETHDQAKALEEKILACWGNHPDFHFVADTDWEAKSGHALALIKECL